MRLSVRSFQSLGPCFILASAAGAQAPPSTPVVSAALAPLRLSADSNVAVRLTDGSTMYGRLVRRDADSVVIVGVAGRIAVATVSVSGLRDAGQKRVTTGGKTEYWYPNANSTRLFFSPTGRTLDQGTGYFANHYLFLASAAQGFTDRFQMGVGSVIFPTTEFWYLMPKFGVIRGEHFNVAVGALYGGVGDVTGGIAYAVGTLGSRDRSVTLGIGQGISGEKFAGEPLVMLGAEGRVSRGIALVTENYLGPGIDGAGLMYGLRFLGERMTVDLALVNSTNYLGFPGLPYVDFVIKW